MLLALSPLALAVTFQPDGSVFMTAGTYLAQFELNLGGLQDECDRLDIELRAMEVAKPDWLGSQGQRLRRMTMHTCTKLSFWRENAKSR